MATVAVVGAGIAGLACGQRLKKAGHQVIWLEKSRGIGGRMATRRLGDGAWSNHGLRSWPSTEPGLQELTQALIREGILSIWSAQGFAWQGQLMPKPGLVHCTESGVNAIAKYLAKDATIQRQQRVTALIKTSNGWQITTNGPRQSSEHIDVDAVVLAIPAPQAASLLAPLDSKTLETLTSLEYASCVSLMATYRELADVPALDHQQGWHITTKHPVLAWLSLESSKPTKSPGIHAVLIQSQADFAAHYLEQLDTINDDDRADQLQDITVTQMLTATNDILPGLGQPHCYQLHRWRYSTVRKSYPEPFLKTPWATLVCCGDWCGATPASNLAAAYHSGIAASNHLQQTIV